MRREVTHMARLPLKGNMCGVMQLKGLARISHGRLSAMHTVHNLTRQ